MPSSVGYFVPNSLKVFNCLDALMANGIICVSSFLNSPISPSGSAPAALNYLNPTDDTPYALW